MISRALTMLSDERLAQLAAAGSDPAFSALYSRYSGTLFAYCRSITRNAEDGWDALQNAMIKVLVALRRSERSAPVRPWLFCIAHNEAVGVLRRRASAERVANAAEAGVVAGADEEALIRERVSEVVSDVLQLPTGQRAALVMRELADLRYDEIAVALQTTEGNARQLVFAARAGLRDSRAGRGLPCESVRDQLSLADGRLLRRRSVRAHLRTCDGCREYAVSVRRRAGQPARAFGAWSPLAGYDLLQSVFRAAADAGGAAIAQGGASVFGPLALKAAAVTAVVATGLGAADVATMTPPRSLAAAAADSAAQAATGRSGRSASGAATGNATPAPVTVAPAVSRTAATMTFAIGPARRSKANGTSKPAARTVAADPVAGHHNASPPPQGSHRAESPDPRAPARARANCNGRDRAAEQARQPARNDSGSAQTRPARDDHAGDGTTRNVAFTGDAGGRPHQHRDDAAPAQAPAPAGAQAGVTSGAR